MLCHRWGFIIVGGILLTIIVFYIYIFSSRGARTRAVRRTVIDCRRFAGLHASNTGSTLVCSTLCRDCHSFITILSGSRPKSASCSRTGVLLVRFLPLLRGKTTCCSGGGSVGGTILFTRTFISLTRRPTFRGSKLAQSRFCPSVACFTTSICCGSGSCQGTVQCLHLCLRSNSNGGHRGICGCLTHTCACIKSAGSTVTILCRKCESCPQSFSVLSITVGGYVRVGSVSGLRFFLSGTLTIGPSSGALLGVRKRLCRRVCRCRGTLGVCDVVLVDDPGDLAVARRITLGGCGLNIVGCSRTGVRSSKKGTRFCVRDDGSCFTTSTRLFRRVVCGGPNSIGCARTLTLTCYYLKGRAGLHRIGTGLSTLKSPCISPGTTPPLVTCSSGDISLDMAKSGACVTRGGSGIRSDCGGSSLSCGSSTRTPIAEPTTGSEPTARPTSHRSRTKASSISVSVPIVRSIGAGAFTIMVYGRGCDVISPIPVTLGSNRIFNRCYRGALKLPRGGIHLCGSTAFKIVVHTVHSVGKVTRTFRNSVRIVFCCTNRNIPSRSAGSTFLLPVSTSNVRARNYCSLGHLCDRLNNLNTHSIFIFLSTYFDNTDHRNDVLTSTHNITLGPGGRSPGNGVIVFDTTSSSRATVPCGRGNRNLFACFLLGGLGRDGNSIALRRLNSCVVAGIGRRSLIIGHGGRAPDIIPSRSVTAN